MSDLPPDSSLNRPSLLHSIAAVAGARSALASFSLTGLFVVSVFFVLHVARVVFIPLALALMLSLLFQPFVRRVSRRFVPRAVVGAIVVASVIGLLGVGALGLSSPAVQWTTKLPRSLQVIERKVRPLKRPVDKVSALAEQVEKLTEIQKTPGVREVRLAERGLASLALETIFEVIIGGVVMLFGFYFLLTWGETFLSRVVRIVPDLREQRRAEAVIREIERRMSTYLGTITLINV